MVSDLDSGNCLMDLNMQTSCECVLVNSAIFGFPKRQPPNFSKEEIGFEKTDSMVISIN